MQELTTVMSNDSVVMLRPAMIFLALEEKPLQINSVRIQHSVTNLGVGLGREPVPQHINIKSKTFIEQLHAMVLNRSHKGVC